jgi:hypothetical protein
MIKTYCKFSDLPTVGCTLERCGERRDMHRKSRGRENYGPRPELSGEKHPRSTFTDAQRRSIVEEYHAGGVSQEVLGIRYGVSQKAISNVVRKGVV